jgi:hypothetical protein
VARVAEGHGLGEIGREVRHPLLDALEMSQQLDAHRLQRAVVQVVPPSSTAGLDVRDEPSRWVRKVGEGHIEERRLESPGHEVSIAEATMHPRRPSTGDEDVPA